MLTPFSLPQGIDDHIDRIAAKHFFSDAGGRGFNYISFARELLAQPSIKAALEAAPQASEDEYDAWANVSRDVEPAPAVQHIVEAGKVTQRSHQQRQCSRVAIDAARASAGEKPNE